MISKIPKVTWPKGTFIETMKLWQQEWFYLADNKEGPVFSAEPPKRLVSWTNKNIAGVNEEEVKVLQGHIKAMVDSGVTLTDVVHVMLLRHALPLQIRATPMWRYKS